MLSVPRAAELMLVSSLMSMPSVLLSSAPLDRVRMVLDVVVPSVMARVARRVPSPETLTWVLRLTLAEPSAMESLVNTAPSLRLRSLRFLKVPVLSQRVPAPDSSLIELMATRSLTSCPPSLRLMRESYRNTPPDVTLTVSTFEPWPLTSRLARDRALPALPLSLNCRSRTDTCPPPSTLRVPCPAPPITMVLPSTAPVRGTFQRVPGPCTMTVAIAVLAASLVDDPPIRPPKLVTWAPLLSVSVDGVPLLGRSTTAPSMPRSLLKVS